MSAFVVRDETINQVVAFLRNEMLIHGIDDPTGPLREAGYNLVWNPARLAQEMFALNVQAVEEGYGEGTAAKFRPLDFAHQPVPPPADMVAYKLLQCWLYQCAEGTVPSTPLYLLMDKIKNNIARKIVHNLPAYEAAPWG